MSDIDELIKIYDLKPHPEGGWFKEGHKPKLSKKDERPKYCNCLFLLAKDEIDTLHKLDCDEIWYFHKGCGMIIYTISKNNKVNKILFGNDVSKGQIPCVVFKKGTIFGGENIDKSSYTLFNCLTIPGYIEKGFKLVREKDIDKHIKINKRFFSK